MSEMRWKGLEMTVYTEDSGIMRTPPSVIINNMWHMVQNRMFITLVYDRANTRTFLEQDWEWKKSLSIVLKMYDIE